MLCDVWLAHVMQVLESVALVVGWAGVGEMSGAGCCIWVLLFLKGRWVGLGFEV